LFGDTEETERTFSVVSGLVRAVERERVQNESNETNETFFVPNKLTAVVVVVVMTAVRE